MTPEVGQVTQKRRKLRRRVLTRWLRHVQLVFTSSRDRNVVNKSQTVQLIVILIAALTCMYVLYVCMSLPLEL